MKTKKYRVHPRINTTEQYVQLLESLVLEAEDVAMRRGDLGLCDCTDNHGNHYQSHTCAVVVEQIRAKATSHAH